MNYEEFKEGVRLQLKELRKKNKETQETLASAIKTSKENLSKIEQGKVNLTLENLFEIVEHYHTSYDYICKGKDHNTPLENLESFISIEFEQCGYGTQKLQYPILQINQALFDYLLQNAYAERYHKLPEHIKEEWKKEEKRKFYTHIDNKEYTKNKEFVLVKKELIYPDQNKEDWKQADLLREIDKSLIQ